MLKINTYIFYSLIILVSIIAELLLYKISNSINYQYNKKLLIISIIISIVLNMVFVNKYGQSIVSILFSIIISILVSISIIDFKYQEIPNWYNLAIFIIGIIVLILNNTNNYLPYIISSIILFAFSFVLMCISSLGGGDVKLLGALGITLHYYNCINVLFYGCITGMIYCIPILIYKKIKNKKDEKESLLKLKIAFGPFLAMGYYITLLL